MTARGRLLVVSHSCVVPVNQSVFAELARRGWDVHLVVPHRWKHDFDAATFEPQPLPELAGGFERRRVLFAGDPARHVYVPPIGPLVRRLRPHCAYVEQETFTPAALQWGRVLRRARVPFGVVANENLDRRLPLPARACRRWTLRHAQFVGARSPDAQALVHRWGARGNVELAPYGVPPWSSPVPKRRPNGVFTIGYAGRLVAEKGLRDLLAAVERVQPPARLLLVGDGPLRAEVTGRGGGSVEIEVRDDVTHGDMHSVYPEMDVLVLPSRTTAAWAEQFGRVLVEALSCGTPVVGSDSGAIPWVIESTGGGHVFHEGDVDGLAGTLRRLQADDTERERLGRHGRERALSLFSTVAAADALERLLFAAWSRS